MKNRIILLFLILNSVVAKSQIWDSLIIKTHPLRDIVTFNPNIAFEKMLGKKISVEIEFTYKNKDDEWGGKGIMDGYKKCFGYRTSVGLKKYFTKFKTIPTSWYVLGQIEYRNIYLPNFIFDKNGQQTFENINKYIFNVNVLFGKGFLISEHIFSEINFGVGIYSENWQAKYLSGSSIDFVNGDRNIKEFNPDFFINWDIGYLIK